MESELCATLVQYPSTNVIAQLLFLFLTDDKRRFCMVVLEHLFLWFNGKSTSWENRAMGVPSQYQYQRRSVITSYNYIGYWKCKYHFKVPLLICGPLYKLAGNAMTMFYCEPVERSPAKFQSLVLLKIDFEYFRNINNFASMCACASV